ncbi:PAS domain S-box protein [Skermanella mucosa]|uniref:PAS domain S-box protein n=1 Tax=Skermanella mucosa TaxID=1789672 RepID=UPI00389A550C
MATRLCKVLEWQRSEDRLLVRAGVGWAAGLVGHAIVGADLESPAGFALKTGRPVISNHLAGETRFRTPRLLAEHGVRRAINVVIRDGVPECPFGVLEVDSPDPGHFEEDDLAFMQGFANLLGVAIERQKAEDGLNRSHDRTLEILESISDAFYAVDGDWRFTYVNRKAEEWWGRRREDLIGKVYWEEFPQAVGSEAYEAHQEAMRLRRHVHCETVSPILGHWVDVDIHPTATGGLSVYFRDVTERRRTQEALRVSEDRLRFEREFLDTLIRRAPVGISIASDPAGQDVTLNDKAKELLGHDVFGGGLERYATYGAVHPDGRHYAVEDYPTVRALTRGEFIDREPMIYLRGGRSGHKRWRLQVSSAPVRSADGTVAAAVTVVMDVEDQHRRAEQLQALADASLAVTAALTLDATLAEIVTAAREIIGAGHARVDLAGDQGRDEAFAAPVREIRRPVRLGRSTLAVPLVSSRGRELGMVRVSDKPDGEEFSSEDEAMLLQLAHLASAAIEQAQSEERLRRLNETLEERVVERTRERDRLWELSEDLLVVADYHARLLRVSPSWSRLLGHDEAALLARPYPDIIHPDDIAGVSAHLETLRSGGQPVRFENRIRAADGSWKWIAWVLSADPNGEHLHGVGRDVTAEKAATEALRVAEEQLRQAQKMEALGQLTGGVAHDFNNLLQGIGGSLEAVERRLEAGRTDIGHFSRAARLSVDRAATLTQRLLAFSRRQPLDPEIVDLNALVAGMKDLVRRSVGESVRVKTAFEEQIWFTWADVNQIENVLLNLAINARDAMPDGGLLTIRTANIFLDGEPSPDGTGVQAGDYVMLAVTDTGKGMAPEVLARAFEPFFTTKPVGQGTGLGLSQLYGFARQSGGHTQIDSTEGRGTSVKLYLPRHRGVPETTVEPVAEPASSLEAQGTVLVVEDEMIVSMVLVETLEEQGYTVLDAAEGQAALRILESPTPIDLLVTDVGLPGINGRQLAEMARVLRPALKVLFLTGYARQATDGDAFQGPDTGLISKPVAMDVFLAKVRSMTRRT